MGEGWEWELKSGTVGQGKNGKTELTGIPKKTTRRGVYSMHGPQNSR